MIALVRIALRRPYTFVLAVQHPGARLFSRALRKVGAAANPEWNSLAKIIPPNMRAISFAVFSDAARSLAACSLADCFEAFNNASHWISAK
jgi:hypothetical protein